MTKCSCSLEFVARYWSIWMWVWVASQTFVSHWFKALNAKSFEKLSYTKGLKEWLERAKWQTGIKTNLREKIIESRKREHYHFKAVQLQSCFSVPLQSWFLLYVLILCRAWCPSKPAVEYGWTGQCIADITAVFPTPTAVEQAAFALVPSPQDTRGYCPAHGCLISLSLSRVPRKMQHWLHVTPEAQHPVSFHSPAQHLPWLFSFLQRKLASNYFTIWAFLGPCQEKGKLASKLCDSSLFSSSAYEPAFCLTGSSLD